MAAARDNARKLLNGRGVYYPVGIGPWGIVSDNTFWCQKSNAAYAAVNMVMRFDCTRDAAYARSTAYPFMKELAEFWEGYLKFEDGRYVIYDDAIHESSESHDMNPVLSLGPAADVVRVAARHEHRAGRGCGPPRAMGPRPCPSQRVSHAATFGQDRVPLHRERHGLVRGQHARHPARVARGRARARQPAGTAPGGAEHGRGARAVGGQQRGSRRFTRRRRGSGTSRPRSCGTCGNSASGMPSRACTSATGAAGSRVAAGSSRPSTRCCSKATST